jgi:hypothetical protein
MKCERGAIEAAVTLAPTMPPTVQFMEVREANGRRPAATCTP